MTEQTTGIVLRTYPLTETSLIAHWLTADLGRVATAARGARRPKSPFRGKVDLFYRADLALQRSRASQLHTLREVRVIETHDALRYDVLKLAQAAYFAALIELGTEIDTPLPAVYALLTDTLAQLALHPARLETVLGFEAKFLEQMGLNPAKHLPASVKQADKFLERFIAYHLGKVPPSRKAAVDVR